MQSMLLQIDWMQKGLDLGLNIVQAIIIALITGKLISVAYIKHRDIGRKLNKYGIDSVSIRNGMLRPRDANILFGEGGNPYPAEIKLCFITGYSFFCTYIDKISNLLDNNTKVKILLACPQGAGMLESYKKDFRVDSNINKLVDYYADLFCKKKESENFLEREFEMLRYTKFMTLLEIKNESDKEANIKANLKEYFAQNADDVFEVLAVVNLLIQLKKSNVNGKNLEWRYYNDEYQMPITIANLDNGTTYLWTNINAPTKGTAESVNIRCAKKEDDDAVFVEEVETSFNYLFKKYEKYKNFDFLTDRYF